MPRIALFLTIGFATLVSACGRNAGPPPRKPVILQPEARQPSFGDMPVAAINRGLDAGEMLWHLRAGLNVAAISCRGGKLVAPAYNRMLALHREPLAAAYKAELVRFGTGAAGIRNRDTHETRLYNFYSNPKGQAQLCASAATILSTINSSSPDLLEAAAPRMLAQLEAGVH